MDAVKPYKILYHHRIASKDGQYVHVEEIIKALKAAGHQVCLVAPHLTEQSEFGSSGGLVAWLKTRMPKQLYELMELSYAVVAFIKLLVAIYKFKPDFIYERFNLFLPAGVWASKCCKLPLLLEVNAPIYEERSKYDGIALSRLAQWSQHYCWKNADRCFPVTQVLAEYLLNAGVKPAAIEVIPNGINEAVFSRPQITPDALPDLQHKLVIGFVGFCREWHGLDRVLTLMAKLANPKLFFLIIGDGPAIAGLKQQAAELQISQQIFVSGLVNRDDMPNWLAQMDIALQPDVVPYASPLKMLEYMYMAKAIIAPDTANIRELLQHNVNALLFDPADANSFTQCLNQLCDQPELVAELGNNAKQSILQHKLTWANNAGRIVQQFELCR